MIDDRPDPWGELSARYEHDADAQFLLIVEQLTEVRTLLLSDEVSKLRMALVALDNLAEVVLHRHKQQAHRIAQEGWTYDVPRLDARELRRFQSDFGARVRLARRGGEDYLSQRVLRPLLDDLDEAIFRTGHAYRNRVYHADHHNPTVLPLIARSYMAAVGRAFTRQQPRDIAHSISEWKHQQLLDYGYDAGADPERKWGSGLHFEPEAAADAIVANLTDGLRLDMAHVRRELCADLAWRTDWAEGMVSHLAGEGLPASRLTSGIAWGQFWDTRGNDEELVRIANAQAALWNDIVESNDEDDAEEKRNRLEKLQAAHEARFKTLFSDFEPTFDLGEIESVRAAGARLATARDLGALFTRYHVLDQRLQEVERALADAAIGWDRHLQEEEDRAREDRLLGE